MPGKGCHNTWTDMRANNFIPVIGCIVGKKIKTELKIIGDAGSDLNGFMQRMIGGPYAFDDIPFTRKSKIAVQFENAAFFGLRLRTIYLDLIIILCKKSR